MRATFLIRPRMTSAAPRSSGLVGEEASPQYDGVVSFVLYNTHAAEIEAAVSQVLSSVGSYHVVLVDNSEPPLDLDRYMSGDVTIIRSGGNIGYGSGHNLALRRFAGKARYHLVLNTDLAFEANVIPALIQFMDDNPSTGMAMPMVRYPNGDLQHLCRILPRPIDVIARAFFSNRGWSRALTRRYELHDWAYDSPLSIPFLSGCFMIIRPGVIEEAGYFDERFFLFAEDLDLSRRLHRISDTKLCPSVSVIHEYRTKTSRSWKRQMYLMRSLIQYFNKYGWIVDQERSAMNRRALSRINIPSGDAG